MLEDEIEAEYDHWKDKEFLAELEKRTMEYKSGEVQGIPWEDVKIVFSTPAEKRNEL